MELLVRVFLEVLLEWMYLVLKFIDKFLFSEWFEFYFNYESKNFLLVRESFEVGEFSSDGNVVIKYLDNFVII